MINLTATVCTNNEQTNVLNLETSAKWQQLADWQKDTPATKCVTIKNVVKMLRGDSQNAANGLADKYVQPQPKRFASLVCSHLDEEAWQRCHDGRVFMNIDLVAMQRMCC